MKTWEIRKSDIAAFRKHVQIQLFTQDPAVRQLALEWLKAVPRTATIGYVNTYVNTPPKFKQIAKGCGMEVQNG